MHISNTVLFPQGNVSHIEHFTSDYITLFIIEKGMLHGYVAYLFMHLCYMAFSIRLLD